MFPERVRSGRGADERPDNLTTLPQIEPFAQIKVIGVGGGGSNAVDRMIESPRCAGWTSSPSTQTPRRSCAPRPRCACASATASPAASAPAATPPWAQKAAEESRDDLLEALKGADMIFIAAGMGGGTGTGAAPIVAEISREIGALTVGVVTRPFQFEGSRRTRHAQAGIGGLRERVDTLITIPNDRLLAVADKRLPMVEAYKLADDVLRQGIQGISDLITVPGLINLDFADVKAVMAERRLGPPGHRVRQRGESRREHAPRPPSPAPCWTSPSTARGASCSTSPGARTSPSTKSTRPRRSSTRRPTRKRTSSTGR